MPARRSGQISNPGAFGSMYQTQAPGSRPTTWGYAPDGGLMGYDRRTGKAVAIPGAMPESSPDMNPQAVQGLLSSNVPTPPERPAGLGGPSWGDYAPSYNTANTTSQSQTMMADAVQQGQVGQNGFWSTGPGWGDTAMANTSPFGKVNSLTPTMASAGVPEAFSGYPTAQDFESHFPGMLSWTPSLPDWGAPPSPSFEGTYWNNPQMASTGNLSQLPQVPTPPVRPFDLGVQKPAVKQVPHADMPQPPPGVVGADMASTAPKASGGPAYGTAGNPLSASYMAARGLGDATPAQLATSTANGAGLGDAPTSGWGQTGFGLGGGLLGGAVGGPIGALAGGLAGRYVGGLLGYGPQKGADMTRGFQPTGGAQGQAGIRFSDGSFGNLTANQMAINKGGVAAGSFGVGPGTSGLY